MTAYFNTRATQRSLAFVPTKHIIFEWRINHFSGRASFGSRRTRAEREREFHKRRGRYWRWRNDIDMRRGI